MEGYDYDKREADREAARTALREILQGGGLPGDKIAAAKLLAELSEST